MKKVLIITSSGEYLFSKGALNEEMTNIAKKELQALGYKVNLTYIKDDYNPDEEVAKIKEADIIIFQYPIWWFGTPWKLKQYFDVVFSKGQGTLYANDGRTRSDLSKQYGSGGLCTNKKYMISVTWNAPISSFDNNNFLSDGLELQLLQNHKACQFLGMSALPSFQINDVIKNPNPEQWFKDWKEHLIKHFA